MEVPIDQEGEDVVVSVPRTEGVVYLRDLVLLSELITISVPEEEAFRNTAVKHGPFSQGMRAGIVTPSGC